MENETNEKPNVVQLNVLVRPSLKQQIVDAALVRGIKIGSFVEQALEDALLKLQSRKI